MSTATIAAPTRLLPTPEVIAGPGAGALALAGVGRGGAAIVYDPVVRPFLRELLCSDQHPACSPLSETPTLADVERMAGWLGAQAVGSVVAIGGGSVMDLVKLGAIVAENPQALARIRRFGSRVGYVRAPHARRRLRVLAIPTTIGTGAEVSSVAYVGTRGDDRLLVHSPALRPDLAVLDPAATRTLPIWLLREGTLEALLRVIGPEIGAASTMPLAPFEAHDLAGRLAGGLDALVGDEADSDELRLLLAQLSGASHRGWALAGRGEFPSPLWFVASELSSVLGCRKMIATALLLPGWLQRVATGDDRWGDKQRLGRLWPAIAGTMLPRDIGSATQSLLEHWQLRPPSAAGNAGIATARRATTRWGGRLPMLGRFTEADVTCLVDDALTGWRYG